MGANIEVDMVADIDINIDIKLVTVGIFVW